MATMLDCKKIQARISEYVDGALDRETAWSIGLHLASCGVCSLVEGELRATTHLLRSLPSTGPSADFEAKLAMRLADQVLQPRPAPLLSRVRDWWYDAPYARPAVTSGLALAAVLPAAFLIFGGHGAGHPANPRSPVSGIATASASSGDNTLEQVWAEHASSDPLGDNSGMLLTPTSLSSDGAAAPPSPADTRQNL